MRYKIYVTLIRGLQTTFKIFCFLFIVCGTFTFGYYCSYAARPAKPEPTVTEMLMKIQEIVGCHQIDARIGPETTRLVNDWVKDEQDEQFNKWAKPYFEVSK